MLKKLAVPGAALIAALALTGSATAAAYSDAACRTAPVTYTNDPCAGNQWGLDKVKAAQAWSTTRGAGVTVAVVDTGADFNNPDLAANLIAKPGSNMLKNTAYGCRWMKPGRNAKSSTASAQDDQVHG